MPLPIHVFNNHIVQDASMGATVTSESIPLNTIISFCVQIVWSAGSTPMGVTYLEASNDNTNWTQVTDSVLAVSGNTGSNMVNVEKSAYGYVRVVYLRSSGSGILNVTVNGKRM